MSRILSARIIRILLFNLKPKLTTHASHTIFQNIIPHHINGWRVIHFPNQQATFEDREIDVIGYEFCDDIFISYSRKPPSSHTLYGAV